MTCGFPSLLGGKSSLICHFPSLLSHFPSLQNDQANLIGDEASLLCHFPALLGGFPSLLYPFPSLLRHFSSLENHPANLLRHFSCMIRDPADLLLGIPDGQKHRATPRQPLANPPPGWSFREIYFSPNTKHTSFKSFLILSTSLWLLNINPTMNPPTVPKWVFCRVDALITKTIGEL